MIRGELADRVDSLTHERRPFVLATVVRARKPTSVRPGDAAVVTGDGVIDGFVGGVCAETSVRLHALRAMETGEPLLLRLIPDGPDGDRPADAGDQLDGAVVERNPCLSGGALEIFLEPHLPAARVIVLGHSPIALAIESLSRASGHDCVRAETGEGVDVTGAAAVVVASHGRGEEEALSAALAHGVPYVGLVASPKRGAAVRSELDVAPDLAAQLHTPAGLDIGARGPSEIAIAILAEMVAAAHAQPGALEDAGVRPDPGPAAPATDARPVTLGVVSAGPAAPPEAATVAAPSAVVVAVDPVCGMRVAVVDATPRLELDGESLYFCCDGCRGRYAAAHGA